MDNLVVIRAGETMRSYPFENKPELPENVEKSSLYLVKLFDVELPDVELAGIVKPYGLITIGVCKGGWGWVYCDERTRDEICTYMLEIHDRDEKIMDKWCWLLIGLSEHLPELRGHEIEKEE